MTAYATLALKHSVLRTEANEQHMWQYFQTFLCTELMMRDVFFRGTY